MTDLTTSRSAIFDDLFGKQVIAQFDQPDSSSDGGALLLKACDQKLGLTQALADCVVDQRQAGKVEHSMLDLIRQRVFGIACGYEDTNDASRLSHDPMHKMLTDRDPVSGAALGSQATLCRFENAIGAKTLMKMGNALADRVIERQRKRRRGKARLITVDLDPTEDTTYGGQQLSFFNGHYSNWCYLPTAGFVQFDQEPEQYLFAYLLRPGNVGAGTGAIGLLRRVLGRLRKAFPGATLRVRLDGGFAGPQMFAFLESQRVGYVVAMAGNSRLKAFAEPLLTKARRASKRSGKTEHRYGECGYGAQSWNRQRRVIIKAEVVQLEGRQPRDNPRFVVTNLRHGPRRLYEQIYCERGQVENRIKELKYGLAIDRTSCTRFWANQLRVLLTAAAYVLFQELRYQARHTQCRHAQVSTLRERLLKLGVWIRTTTRRIVLHLPDSAPWRCEWYRIARSLGAVPG